MWGCPYIIKLHRNPKFQMIKWCVIGSIISIDFILKFNLPYENKVFIIKGLQKSVNMSSAIQNLCYETFKKLSTKLGDGTRKPQ